MALQQLGSVPAALSWLVRRGARGLVTDSRRLEPGDAFIAWPGLVHDGRQHVKPALTAGAAACVIEADGAEVMGFDDLRIAAMDGLKANAGPLASAFFGAPSERLSVIAITGTNGKTSTAWWLAQALSQARAGGCGVIGTLGIGRPPQVEYTGLTTPDPVRLQAQLRRFVDAGLSACAMEASSIGIVERRLDGTRIAVAVFTNFTRDHLDYHGTLQAYWAAKASLFAWPGLRAAVVNVDDEKGEGLAQTLAGQSLDLWTVSCHREDARLRAQDIAYDEAGLHFTVVEGAQHETLHTQMIGHYNAANLLAVIGAMRAVGIALPDAVRACANLLPVPGRMERLHRAGHPLVAVDYAHTPDALDKALHALRPLAQQRGGRLWCVFGCGGDRDTSKRPLMAAVAEALADRVVVTSDNPRHEKPQAIISQILLGLSHRDAVEVEIDRARAIASTVQAAAPADVILLAGKGHEDHQEIDGVRTPFDDRVHARRALDERASA